MAVGGDKRYKARHLEPETRGDNSVARQNTNEAADAAKPRAEKQVARCAAPSCEPATAALQRHQAARATFGGGLDAGLEAYVAGSPGPTTAPAKPRREAGESRTRPGEEGTAR